MSAKTKSFFPNSEKVYISGNLHPDIRVPFREITLTPTHSRMERLRKMKRCAFTIPVVCGVTIHNPMMWNPGFQRSDATGFWRAVMLNLMTDAKFNHRTTAISPKDMNNMHVCDQNQRVD